MVWLEYDVGRLRSLTQYWRCAQEIECDKHDSIMFLITSLGREWRFMDDFMDSIGWPILRIISPNKAVLTTVNRSQSETILQLKPPMVCDRFTRGGRPLRSVDNKKNKIQRISRTFHHMIWTRSFLHISRSTFPDLTSLAGHHHGRRYLAVTTLQKYWDLSREFYRTRRSIRPLTVRCERSFLS